MGERVQEQSNMRREGKGFVVVDVKAPVKAVWDVLLDFESYPQTIPTVRSMTMFTNTNLKESYFAERPVQAKVSSAPLFSSLLFSSLSFPFLTSSVASAVPTC